MTILIIGASSGIGKKLANNLSDQGKKIIATYHTHPISDPKIDYFPLNVLEENPNLDFLPSELSGLVYCPGAIELKSFERISPQDFVLDYQLQVIGAIKILQKALPLLKKNPEAAVVLFTTVAVELGLSFHSQVAASKGAIAGLVRALAAEYAPKIRFNAIAPSLTDTPLAQNLLNTEQKRETNAARHPLKRIGTTEDIAQMAAFLLSPASSFITGQIFPVDGGISVLKI